VVQQAPEPSVIAGLALWVHAARAEVFRESRPAMGTLVGITVRAPSNQAGAVRAAIAGAYAAIEVEEQEISEWREGSTYSRMMRGETVQLSPWGVLLLTTAAALREATGGRYDIGWRGGKVVEGPDGYTGHGRIDTGSIAKGVLVDVAVAHLYAAGLRNFAVDAAGDAYLAGDQQPLGYGWRTSATGTGQAIRVRDGAVSSSGQQEQPGHLRSALDGEPSACLSAVFVVAPTGTLADPYATATFVSCAPPRGAPPDVWISAVAPGGVPTPLPRRYKGEWPLRTPSWSAPPGTSTTARPPS